MFECPCGDVSALRTIICSDTICRLDAWSVLVIGVVCAIATRLCEGAICACLCACKYLVGPCLHPWKGFVSPCLCFGGANCTIGTGASVWERS